MTNLTSYSLVPELQHAYNKFIMKYEMNKYHIPVPVNIPELYLTPNCFIDMLFNDEYNQPDYVYKYIEETNPFAVPRTASSRIQIYPRVSKYLIMDESGTDIFNLQSDDFMMLDALLSYRSDSTSLVVVDTTSTSTLVIDSTSGLAILTINYDNLSTELSKLIYIYLDLKINGNYERYDNMQIISTGGLLETCYEAYVLENYFQFIFQNAPNLMFDMSAYCEDV